MNVLLVWVEQGLQGQVRIEVGPAQKPASLSGQDFGTAALETLQLPMMIKNLMCLDLQSFTSYMDFPRCEMLLFLMCYTDSVWNPW